MVQLLLDAELEVDAQMLWNATKAGSLEAIQMLLRYSSQVASQEAVKQAMVATSAREGHIHLLNWFSSNGYTYDSHKVYRIALYAGHLPVIMWLRERHNITPASHTNSL